MTSYSCFPFWYFKENSHRLYFGPLLAPQPSNNLLHRVYPTYGMYQLISFTYENYWEEVHLSLGLCLCLFEVHKHRKIWPPELPIHKGGVSVEMQKAKQHLLLKSQEGVFISQVIGATKILTSTDFSLLQRHFHLILEAPLQLSPPKITKYYSTMQWIYVTSKLHHVPYKIQNPWNQGACSLKSIQVNLIAYDLTRRIIFHVTTKCTFWDSEMKGNPRVVMAQAKVTMTWLQASNYVFFLGRSFKLQLLRHIVWVTEEFQ